MDQNCGDLPRQHLLKGVELFNRGQFFEAHEEMEEAMNVLERDDDWNFYLGLLRAAVANHKLSQGAAASAILHLKAALGFLAGYPDRHRQVKLRELRQALNLQLARLQRPAAQGRPAPPHIELLS